MTPPVIFIVFNRPDTTAVVLEAIRKARPEILYVVADGPRPGKKGEAERCAETRKIIESVDWPCKVIKDFSDVNMGCKTRVSSGITNAFKVLEEAIILEDDCVPSPSFFRFTGEILEYYRDSEEVMLVSGDNRLFGKATPELSYYFSRYPNIWGWATWRRAWQHYDITMKDWPKFREGNTLKSYFDTKSERYYWKSLFDYSYYERMNTWAYRWVYSIFKHNGLCVVPGKNLVKNIGFTSDATHTTSGSIWEKLEAEELDFPLLHPTETHIDQSLDKVEQRIRIRNMGMLPYPLNAIKDLLRDIFYSKG